MTDWGWASTLWGRGPAHALVIVVPAILLSLWSTTLGLAWSYLWMGFYLKQGVYELRKVAVGDPIGLRMLQEWVIPLAAQGLFAWYITRGAAWCVG